MSAPDPRFRTVDADSSLLSQINEATARFITTSGNPPPLPWLIEDWLPAEETTLLAGPGSGGKSYLALQMQVSAALGVPWLGLPLPQCPSLGFIPRIGSRRWRTGCTRSRGHMTTTSEWIELRRTLESLGPKLLILDNLADFLPVPSFDNSAIRQARRMALDPLCSEYGVTILGLQNVTLTGLRATDEAEGSSGGLAWRDAFRSRLYLRCEKADAEDPDAGRSRTLNRIKSNHAADETSSIPLKWQDGMWVPDRPSGDTVDRIEQNANKRWLMDAVVRIVKSGRAYSTARNQPSYLPNLLEQEPDRPGRFGAKGIKSTYEVLVCRDDIAIRPVRDPAKGRSIERVVAVNGRNLQADNT